MATQITLPKDAEGREIPLDTETLYDKDGKEIEVSRYQYYPKVGPDYWNIRSERNQFYGQDEVYLTKPDSWEKLEEDLDRCADAPDYEECAYFGKDASSCSSCVAGKEASCSKTAMRDIASRIRKLRGDDDA